MIRYNPNLHIYYSTKIDECGLTSGFSTKQSPALESFISKKKIVIPHQVHGDMIIYFDYLNNRSVCDGLITDKPNLALTVQTGDCVPIIFADKKRKLIGVSHQGWKGSLLRLPQKMISKFQYLKSNIGDLRIAIGPSIGACCYDIDDERVDAFKKEFASYPSFWQTRSASWRISGASRISQTYLNLLRLNYLQLVESGINPQNIDFFPFCTKCNSEKFYSNRRKDMSSEMINFISIR